MIKLSLKNELSEFERNSIEGERKHYHFVDLTSSDVSREIKEVYEIKRHGLGVNI